MVKSRRNGGRGEREHSKSQRWQSSEVAGQAFRFALSAVAGFAAGLGWAWFFHEYVGWSAELAVALSIILIAVQNFLVLRFWVYKPRESLHPATLAVGFLASTGAFRLLEYVVFLTFHTVLGFHYMLVLVTIRPILMLAKFFFYRTTLFADRTLKVRT